MVGHCGDCGKLDCVDKFERIGGQLFCCSKVNISKKGNISLQHLLLCRTFHCFLHFADQAGRGEAPYRDDGVRPHLRGRGHGGGQRAPGGEAAGAGPRLLVPGGGPRPGHAHQAGRAGGGRGRAGGGAARPVQRSPRAQHSYEVMQMQVCSYVAILNRRFILIKYLDEHVYV